MSSQDKRDGFFLCFVGPAGAGKSTLAHGLLDKYAEQVEFAISATSRTPRPGEENGKQYFFHSREEFQRKIDAGDFFEWEETHGNFYGTPNLFVRKVKEEGKVVLLDVDVRGAVTFSNAFPENFKGVLVLPPSIESLVSRIELRGGLKEGELKTRLQTAKREFEDFREAIKNGVLQFVLINEDKKKAQDEALQIFLGETLPLNEVSQSEALKNLAEREEELLTFLL